MKPNMINPPLRHFEHHTQKGHLSSFALCVQCVELKKRNSPKSRLKKSVLCYY